MCSDIVALHLIVGGGAGAVVCIHFSHTDHNTNNDYHFHFLFNRVCAHEKKSFFANFTANVTKPAANSLKYSKHEDHAAR